MTRGPGVPPRHHRGRYTPAHAPSALARPRDGSPAGFGSATVTTRSSWLRLSTPATAVTRPTTLTASLRRPRVDALTSSDQSATPSTISYRYLVGGRTAAAYAVQRSLPGSGCANRRRSTDSLIRVASDGALALQCIVHARPWGIARRPSSESSRSMTGRAPSARSLRTASSTTTFGSACRSPTASWAIPPTPRWYGIAPTRPTSCTGSVASGSSHRRRLRGPMGGKSPTEPIVGIGADPTWWLPEWPPTAHLRLQLPVLRIDGGKPLNKPIVGIAG